MRRIFVYIKFATTIFDPLFSFRVLGHFLPSLAVEIRQKYNDEP